jgi:hypothetical protein
MTFIEVDRTAWQHDRSRPFALRHGFVDDPRLSHEQVSALAGRLPATSVEMNRADVDPVHAEAALTVDRPAEQVARDVVALRRWMAIKNIEQVPDYRQLLDEGLDSADAGLALGRAMVAREGYIFLSAASSVTPAHLDHEHNLLLQIRGTKTVTLGSFPDAASEQAFMEGGSYGWTGFAPHDPQIFQLEPGTGVYIPPGAVHMVQNGDDLSISFSLVFHTTELEREARVHAVNAKLRRLGLHPRPPGRSVTVDRAKSGAALAWRTARRRN